MSGVKGSASGGGDNNITWFIYKGQPISEIPRDITHVRIDPSVKVIAAEAFEGCEELLEVELCKGLAQIGAGAFNGCKSLNRFKVPHTVKKIATAQKAEKEKIARLRALRLANESTTDSSGETIEES